MSPLPIFCLICDEEIFSSNQSMKYCESCKKKQQESASKRYNASKKVKYTIQKIGLKASIKTCENCKKEFMTRGGLRSLSQRFCSHACQFVVQKNNNRMVTPKSRKSIPKTSPALAIPKELHSVASGLHEFTS